MEHIYECSDIFNFLLFFSFAKKVFKLLHFTLPTHLL